MNKSYFAIVAALSTSLAHYHNGSKNLTEYEIGDLDKIKKNFPNSFDSIKRGIIQMCSDVGIWQTVEKWDINEELTHILAVVHNKKTGKPVGVLHGGFYIDERDNQKVFGFDMCIKQSHQRKGFGDMLLRKAIELSDRTVILIEAASPDSEYYFTTKGFKVETSSQERGGGPSILYYNKHINNGT
jgi:GNAT superfamily N-acetyltransferase